MFRPVFIYHPIDFYHSSITFLINFWKDQSKGRKQKTETVKSLSKKKPSNYAQ